MARRELSAFVNTPIAYIAGFFFLAFTAVWFFYVQQFLALGIASLRGYFSIMPLVFVVLIPALTMSSWAEEKRLGTDELLLTLPFKEHEIVLGKYLASVVVLLGILALTVFVPLTVTPLGQFESGQILGQYIGTALLGAAGLAIGQFVSSFFRNQISAFIVTALVLLALTLIAQVTAFADVSQGAGGVLSYLSLDRHYRGFVRGIVDSRDVVYFGSIIALALYGNTKSLSLGRWL